MLSADYKVSEDEDFLEWKHELHLEAVARGPASTGRHEKASPRNPRTRAFIISCCVCTILLAGLVAFSADIRSYVSGFMTKAPNHGDLSYYEEFMNPILDSGADPWVFRWFDHSDWSDNFYMTLSTNDDIQLLRSPVLTDWNNAERIVIWQPPPGMNYSTNLWAPELHQIDDKWYIIFSADPNYDHPPPEVEMLCNYSCPAVHRRMYVVEGIGDSPWTAKYEFKAQLNTYDQFALDGTYFKYAGTLYHVYSCWKRKYDGWPANLCITKMKNPWTVESTLEERQILSEPTEPWEKTPNGRTENDRLSSNEGPQQLVSWNRQQFIIYSAGRSDNRNYCLGLLKFIGPDDPMNMDHWEKHKEGCVFSQSPEEHAYGVGHASFVKSPDRIQDFIVYHGMSDPDGGWGARSVRMQRFTWNDDGSPNFPRPGYGPYRVPSGQ